MTAPCQWKGAGMDDIFELERAGNSANAEHPEKTDNLNVSRDGADSSRRGGPTAGPGFAACAKDCLMDVSEVADRLRISRSMVYKLFESGRILAIRIGRTTN